MYKNLERNSLESLLIFNSECMCNFESSEHDAKGGSSQQFPLQLELN